MDMREQMVARSIGDRRCDRAVGCLMGLAIGDAIGSPLEFLPAVDNSTPGMPSFNRTTMAYFRPLNEFELEPGQWTDDTAMALCLADSLIIHRAFDGSDFRARLWSWCFRGYNNAFRLDPSRHQSVGLGQNVAKSLYALEPGQPPPPRYESTAEDAGNGSIIRLGPVPIFYHNEPLVAARVGAESSLTTHPGAVASEACAFLAWLLASAINERRSTLETRPFLDDLAKQYLDLLGDRRDSGAQAMRALLASDQPDDSLERNWNWRATTLDIEGTLRRRGGEYNGYPVSADYFGSYCMDGLAIALHSVYHSTSFEEAIERCVNFLGDADSTAAVAGQVAGSFYGFTSVDPRMVELVRRWDEGEIAFRAVLLFELGEAVKTGR